eukprot:8143743-Pyramimonas_sp.AAC.1
MALLWVGLDVGLPVQHNELGRDATTTTRRRTTTTTATTNDDDSDDDDSDDRIFVAPLAASGSLGAGRGPGGGLGGQVEGK